jgi:hypothetical protein
LGLSAIALAMFGALYFDKPLPRPVVMRAGYRVLSADFHVHTTWGDGALSPFGIVRQADRRGLDVVGITEHNRVLPGRLAKAYVQILGGPLVVGGEEVTTGPFHVIALGITTTVSPNQSLAGVLADIHRQGGVAIAAHPVEHFWKSLLPLRADFDGSEVMHPLAYNARGKGWSWQDMDRFHQEAVPPLAAIGSSDYHWGSILGLCRTYVFIEGESSEAAVVDAIRQRRTVTIDLDGIGHGPPTLVAALQAQPVPELSADYNYVGKGPLDRLLQILGLAGVALLLLTRRTPPVAS